ncbi:hypothetical protein CC1G_14801 [Coprinopsis cinerea okayama7|uniref:Uncharacterized protein n=1 Tax=Coprinopsis cinerea (strain Okayama-7 / 130 / ATCC MYA-4618 / FGSC 9003) TaxID=240176 RepID=D6RNI1_COPC7|nr:hypothetical protein CC1G_14801 [Coprinopsis cinerea okayama7\|eukprot:XP_002910822.1 hypothetical protein CC1G_14801 [Coprinopsis cinerea okayama7\
MAGNGRLKPLVQVWLLSGRYFADVDAPLDPERGLISFPPGGEADVAVQKACGAHEARILASIRNATFGHVERLFRKLERKALTLASAGALDMQLGTGDRSSRDDWTKWYASGPCIPVKTCFIVSAVNGKSRERKAIQIEVRGEQTHFGHMIFSSGFVPYRNGMPGYHTSAPLELKTLGCPELEERIQVPQDPRKPAESDLRAKPKIDTRILEQTSKSRKLI